MDYKRLCWYCPPVPGKTIVFCKLAEDCVRDGERVLILRTGAVLDQAADKLSQATGLGCAESRRQKRTVSG